MNVFSVTVLLAGLLSAAVSLAEPPGRSDGRRPDAPPPGHERGQRQDEPRAPEGRPRQDDAERRGQRLSPEERRALRQQINEAGQDLYQPKR